MRNKIVWVISVQICPKILLPHPIFFSRRARWNFGKVVVILSVVPTVSCSAERSLSILQRSKTDQKHHEIASVIWHCYILNMLTNRVDIEKVIDEFSSEKVRSKFFFQPIFIPNNVIDLFWMLSRKYISESCAFQKEY